MNDVFSNSWLDQKHFKENLNRGQIVNPITASKILNSVSKIVNIVHGNNKYQVIFKGQEETGYINYLKKQIVISTSLLKNPGKYSIYDIVDIETGLALHESGHAEYTFSKKLMNEMNNFTELEHHIHNILEDAIMEKIVSNDYPGYEGYFIKLRSHYFKNNKIEKTGNILSDRVNELLIGLRYPGDTIIYDDKVKKSLNIVNDLMELPNEQLKNVDRVQLMRDILKILTSDNDKEKDKNNTNYEYDDYDDYDDDNDRNCIPTESNDETEQDSNSPISWSDAEDLMGELKQFLDSVRQENNSSLSNDELNLLNSFLEEDCLEEEYETSYNKFEVVTCTPKIFIEDIKRYNTSKQRIKKHIMKFRNKFSDANTVYKQNAYGLQSGMLDEDNLYSAKYNRNIFMNNIISNVSRTKNIDIAFTIDCSGSMFANLDRKISRIEAARDLCTLFVEALEPINSINTWVFGFKPSLEYICEKSKKEDNIIYSSDFSESERDRLNKSTHLIRAYSPKDRKKFGIGAIRAGGSTPEYEGLSKTVDILLKESRKDSKKVVVMLTDGDPMSDTFGYFTEIKLIEEKLRECEKKGITVIHLALTSEAEKTPYKHKIKWDKGYESLIDSFLKMLKKQIQ